MAIEGLHAKLWAPKVAKVLVVGFLGFPLGSPKTKCHLDVTPMESYKEYYKGEGAGFPQNRGMVSLVSLRLPTACLGTKSVKTMH
jgi:hypothetical protein